MDFNKAITALLDQAVIGARQWLPAVDRSQGGGDIGPVGGDVVGLLPGLAGEAVLLLVVADLAKQDQTVDVVRVEGEGDGEMVGGDGPVLGSGGHHRLVEMPVRQVGEAQ